MSRVNGSDHPGARSPASYAPKSRGVADWVGYARGDRPSTGRGRRAAGRAINARRAALVPAPIANRATTPAEPVSIFDRAEAATGNHFGRRCVLSPVESTYGQGGYHAPGFWIRSVGTGGGRDFRDACGGTGSVGRGDTDRARRRSRLGRSYVQGRSLAGTAGSESRRARATGNRAKAAGWLRRRSRLAPKHLFWRSRRTLRRVVAPAFFTQSGWPNVHGKGGAFTRACTGADCPNRRG